jgi:hypothetical protein
MDTVTVVLWLSVLLQITAAIMALRLIPLSGRASAWLLFSLVFLLMSVRRFISLLHEAGFIGDPQSLHSMTEPLALVISILIVVAVHLTRGIFADLATTRAQTDEQLDELRRFQKSVVARELRLKELEEENASLKNRLQALQGPAI